MFGFTVDYEVWENQKNCGSDYIKKNYVSSKVRNAKLVPKVSKYINTELEDLI